MNLTLREKMMIECREKTEADNAAVAALIRDNLKARGLDIPGTVYFDEGLDYLSNFYNKDERRYYVIEDDDGQVIGGIGFAGFEHMKDTAELQKGYVEIERPKEVVHSSMNRFFRKEL